MLAAAIAMLMARSRETSQVLLSLQIVPERVMGQVFS